MAKIEFTKTELMWPGKGNEDGTREEVPRISLPFQLIETQNVSAVAFRQSITRTKLDGFVKSRHSGENRSPENL